MKITALLIALTALAALATPPAVAGDRGVVVVHRRPVVVARPFLGQSVVVARPFFGTRPVVVARPLFPQGPLIVQPSFVTPHSVIVQRRVVVPRSRFLFTAPGTVVIVR